MIVICFAMLVFVGFKIEKLGRLRSRRPATAEQEAVESWRRLETRAQWWRFAGWLMGASGLAAGGIAPPEAGPLALALAWLAPLLAGEIAGEILSARAERILNAAGISKKEAMGGRPKRKEKEA
jgi:hypothetical protein